MASKILSLVAMACLASQAHGYSAGAPEGACKDMVPRHPADPQAGPAPYIITTNAKVVKAGQPLEVVISGKSSSDTLRGLLLQARNGDQPIGKFSIPPSANNFAQLLNCGTPGSAVTHKAHEPSEDKHTVAFTWTSPPDFKGDIRFRSTIAMNGAVFWVGVESAPVKVVN